MDEPVPLPINGVLDLHTFKPGEVKDLVPEFLYACRQKGLLDVLWKSRDMLLRPRYGRFGCIMLPYLWVFELAAPVIEIVGLPFAADALWETDTAIASALFRRAWDAPQPV